MKIYRLVIFVVLCTMLFVNCTENVPESEMSNEVCTIKDIQSSRIPVPFIWDNFAFVRTMQCFYITETYDDASNSFRDKYKLTQTYCVGDSILIYGVKQVVPLSDEFKPIVQNIIGGWVVGIYGPAMIHNLKEKRVGSDKVTYSIYFDVRRETNREFKRIEKELKRLEFVPGSVLQEQFVFTLTVVLLGFMEFISMLFGLTFIFRIKGKTPVLWVSVKVVLFIAFCMCLFYQVNFWSGMLLDKYLY